MAGTDTGLAALTTVGADQKKTEDAYRKVSLALLVALGTTILGTYAFWIYSRSFAKAASDADTWLAAVKHNASGYALLLGPGAALVAFLVALLVKYGLPELWKSARASTSVGLLLGGCLVAVGVLNTGALQRLASSSWFYFVPVVPPVLLAHQAIAAWRQRPRSIGQNLTIGLSDVVYKALKDSNGLQRFYEIHDQLVGVLGGTHVKRMAQSATDSVTSTSTAPRATRLSPFVTHFAVPGLLLLVVGFGAVACAVKAPLGGLDLKDPTLELVTRGLRWGAAGAFVYVLMDFGARSFRNDLTVGAATWAVITLIVGPALAVLLAVGWTLTASGGSPWSTGIALFFAGLAPRRVVSIAERAALQLLKGQTPEPATPEGPPLTSLAGITTEVAARLREEGIEDIRGLAYADPIRLVQSVPYDLRRVVDWIDQAVFVITLPKHHEVLREHGVTGAIDLAWRWVNASVNGDGKVESLDGEAIKKAFGYMTSDPDRDAQLVYETAKQLFYEEHVCLLWVMYNSFSTTAGATDPDPSST